MASFDKLLRATTSRLCQGAAEVALPWLPCRAAPDPSTPRHCGCPSHVPRCWRDSGKARPKYPNTPGEEGTGCLLFPPNCRGAGQSQGWHTAVGPALLSRSAGFLGKRGEGREGTG